MIHGRNLIVALDGVAIAGAKSCKLKISQDFIQACSPTEGRVMEKIPTTYDWSVSVDCLIPSSNLPVSLTDKLMEGTKCILTLIDGGGQQRFGHVYVKSCDENGNVGSLATFSASFESTGALYKYAQYHAESFQEGTQWDLIINNGHMELSAGRQEDLLGVGFYVARPGEFYVACDNNWGLVKMNFATVKTKLQQGFPSDIEQAEVTCYVDDNPRYIKITELGYYTFLCVEGTGFNPFGLAFIYK